MTSPPKDRGKQTSPASQIPPPEQIPPPDEDEQITPPDDDEQIKAIVNDNDARLWYITKFGQDKFGENHLKQLVEMRNKFRKDPEHSISDTEEVEYRKATMAATQFLGDRNPEAIRLYADVQRKKASNPLKIWLWGLGIALFFALCSNGYKTVISDQIQRMKETRSQYIEEMTRLALPDNNLANGLSRMCELTLVYRAAASQLIILLRPLKLEPSADTAYSPPGVCRVIQGVDIKEFETDGSAANQQVIEDARKSEFATTEDRAVRVKAELINGLLNLFVLPMLYALLGALTSAIRTANKDFISMTLTRVDGINLGSRVLLGVVGGATIGSVFSANTLDRTTGLTVLGLAFATGYAVDLFFNLLDGIKIGLGGSKAPPPQSS